MIRLLEISWLVIIIISLVIAAYQFISDGFQASIWMIFVSAVAVIMYSIRRRQRIRLDQQNGKSVRQS